MRKNLSLLALAAAAVLLLAGGCGSGDSFSDAVPESQSEDRIVWSTLYCDVSFWYPPVWELAQGTITGDITQQTGVALETMVPAQDADRQLSKMLINDELPDLISVVDPTVIGQLTSSGKVWKLDEFLRKYLSAVFRACAGGSRGKYRRFSVQERFVLWGDDQLFFIKGAGQDRILSGNV